MISIDAVNRVKYALKNSIMLLLCLTVFFGPTSENLTETEQLIATIVPTGLMKILMRNLLCQHRRRDDSVVWFIIKWTPWSLLFNETVIASTYRQMLVDYVWPQLQGKKLYFQHDGAALHYAVIESEWLDEEFPGRWIARCGPFDWPARSPDLTSCDVFLWVYLKDIVFKEVRTSIMQLQNRIQETCAGITKVICRKVCHSAAQRLIYVTV